VHVALAQNGGAPWCDPGASLGDGVELLGATAVGSGARIGSGSVLEDCVVWPGATIASNSKLQRCIVTGNALVSGQHLDADL
jgi:mannose-1-phosphate guanylyltransferase